MKAHAPEPIRCDDHGKIFYANGGCDAFVTDVHFARRIVAAVNACAGIPTEMLERFKTIVGAMDEVSKIEKQRDELLAALITAHATLDRDGDEWGICDQLAAAINSAKECARC